MKFRKKKDMEEEEQPTEELYDESERTLDIGNAHRDKVYELPSVSSQIVQTFMIQMKLFSKARTVWTVLILLVMIPVVFFLLDSFVFVYGSELSHVTNVFLATLLCALPLISIFLSCNICGTMLPQEFNERTVYLSLPLPMSRFTFFIGKFLAGFLLVTGVVCAAYGISIIVAMVSSHATYTFTGALFPSLGMAVASVFFFCAFTYMLSASSKRGAVMKSLLILFVAMPLLVVALYFVGPSYPIAASLSDVLVFLPVFGPNVAINSLGVPFDGFAFSGLDLSINGFFSMARIGMPMTMDISVMSLVAVVLGILCLARGYMKISRRDM